MTTTWKITFSIFRKKADKPGFYQDFVIDIDPDEYVLDGIEKIWYQHDRTLMYRHACHHSTCGACGMRVNNSEKLTCITQIRDVCKDGGRIKVDPLRNFPIVSDLVVDFGDFFQKLDEIDQPHVLPVNQLPSQKGIHAAHHKDKEGFYRLTDCLECGLCVSACPASATDEEYYGPAALAAGQLEYKDGNKQILGLLDQEHGLWRCHSAYECSEVCPSFVEPGSRIMDLRKMTVSANIQKWFSKKQAQNE